MKELDTLVGNAAKPTIFFNGNFAKHKRALHEGIKDPCWQCDEQVFQKGIPVEYEKAFHEGVKYPCGQCDQQFSQM